VLALVLAWVLRRSLLKGDEAPFVMELPPYRLPTPRGLVLELSERCWLYLRKAGTIILALSILMWAATTYPKPESYQIDADIAAGRVQVVDGAEVKSRRAAEEMHHSFAGRLGRAMAPVIAPLGFDWKIGAGLVGALAAKEVFVAQMGIVYSLGDANEESRELREVLGTDYPPLVGLSLMLFLLISAPCIATVALTRRESGSWKWAGLQFGGLTLVAYAIALCVFQLGTLLGLAGG
jgi:ferrous iron transport protein B